MPPLSLTQWLVLLIAGLSIIGVAVGRFPGMRMNRAAIAFAGAAALVAVGALSLKQAWGLVDGDIIILLLSLMVVNTFLSLAGLFRSLTHQVARRAASPVGLLVGLVFTSGLLSAFFLNDTIVLMLTPLLLDICKALERRPLPYLIALAASANVGSVATITGNPQNLIIGLRGGISYLEFLRALGPVALVGLLLVIGVVYVSFRREFAGRLDSVRLAPVSTYRPQLIKTAAISLLMLAAFVLGINVAATAFFAAAALFITRRVHSDKVFARLNWQLLVLFGGLFIITGSLQVSGLSSRLFKLIGALFTSGVGPLSLLMLILSNLISNVPAVLLVSPLVAALRESQHAWLTVAMSSTLAGNLTLVGSVANLIVAEMARRHGVTLGFWAYLRVGLPITLLTVAFGVFWLTLVAR